MEMGLLVPDELRDRMASFADGKSKAHEYDKRANLFSLSTEQTSGGWLRNLLGKAFLKVRNPGATTLAVTHVTGSKLTCAALGDVGIAVYRARTSGDVEEVFSSTFTHFGDWLPQLLSGSGPVK